MPTQPTKMSDLTGFDSLDEFALMPTQEKIERTLANPPPNKDAARANGSLTLGKVNAISKARMRAQFSNLLSAEMPNIQEALGELRKENPKVYIDQMVQLAQFALPQLKSVEVDQGGEGAAASRMSLAELQAALAGGNEDDTVVSVQ